LDANTKLFYLRATNERKQKDIQILQTSDGFAILHEGKEKEIA
jgi:hypothetical protein